MKKIGKEKKKWIKKNNESKELHQKPYTTNRGLGVDLLRLNKQARKRHVVLIGKHRQRPRNKRRVEAVRLMVNNDLKRRTGGARVLAHATVRIGRVLKDQIRARVLVAGAITRTR